MVECAVIGVDFKDGRGELPRAYVVAREGSTDEQIHAWMGSKLAKYKQLAGGIRRVDEIPRIGIGKILRRVFQNEAKKEVELLRQVEDSVPHTTSSQQRANATHFTTTLGGEKVMVS